MIYRGRVKDGVVLIEESTALPEGAEVRVEVVYSNRGAASALMDEWLSDDSGYDEEAWASLKVELDRDRLSTRRLFDG